MTIYRPTYTAPDANHGIPRDYLHDRCGGFEIAPKGVRGNTLAYTANFRGHKVLLVDTSKQGGIFPDWHIEMDTGAAAWIEVKTPEAYKKEMHSLKPGEIWLRRNAQIQYHIIKDALDFEDLLNELLKG